MTRHTFLKPHACSLAVAFALVSIGAQAQSLLELYDSARAFDATYQSAKLQYDANLAKADQAIAGIYPTAALTSGVSRTQFQKFQPTNGPHLQHAKHRGHGQPAAVPTGQRGRLPARPAAG